MSHENPYTVLGVSYESSIDEIKTAFRKLAHQHHPDKGGDEELFKKISGAYTYLLKTHVQRPKGTVEYTAKTPGNITDPIAEYEYDSETGRWWSKKDEDRDGFVAKRTERHMTPAEFAIAVARKKSQRLQEKKKILCALCGKPMKPVFDEVAGTFTGHLWHCDCMPDDMILSIG